MVEPLLLLLVGTLATLVITGVGCLVFARRGRLLNDHPHCRRCGYDLSGHVAPPASCAECGAVLSAGAVVRGTRVPRPKLRWAGRVLLVLGLAVFGWSAFLIATGSSWPKFLPTAMLGAIARTTNDTKRADAVGEELLRRVAAGGLSESEINAIADTVLAARVNPAFPWSDAWSRLVSGTFADARITADRREQDMRASAKIFFGVRPRVAVDRGAIFQLTKEPVRNNARRLVYSTTHVRATLISEDPPRILTDEAMEQTSEFGSGQSMAAFSLGSLKPGKHRVRLSAQGTLTNTAITVPYPLTQEFDVEVLPPGQPSVTVVTDPARNPSNFIQSVTIEPRYRRGEQNGAWQPNITFMVSPLPCSLAVDVLIRRTSETGATEDLLLKSLVIPAKRGGGFGFWGSEKFTLPLRYAETIVLRPHPDLLEATVDQMEAWGGELVFQNVALDWGDAARNGVPIPPKDPTPPTTPTPIPPSAPAPNGP